MEKRSKEFLEVGFYLSKFGLINENKKYPIPPPRLRVVKWNDAYRKGEALVDDKTYDIILESLPTDNQLRNKIGFDVSDNRKAELPIPMFSMDKVKNSEDIAKWLKSKKCSRKCFAWCCKPKSNCNLRQNRFL